MGESELPELQRGRTVTSMATFSHTKKPKPSAIAGIMMLLIAVLITVGSFGLRRFDVRSRASFSGDNADVIIVGAGTGGTAAAIQAARDGVNVILLEETDWVGGQMLAAGVTSMDGGNPAWTGGIYAEFIEKIKDHYQKKGKSIGTCYWSAYTTCFEPHVGKTILEQMIRSHPNISLRLRTQVLAAQTSNGAVTGLTVRQNGSTKSLTAKVVIDATEYGDIIPLTDAGYRSGNATNTQLNPNACIQDVTYLAVMKKYPDGVPQDLKISTPPPGYSDDVKSIFQSVIHKTGTATWTGAYPVNWDVHNAYRGMPDSSSPGNYDASTPHAITKTGVNWANDYPRNAYASSNSPFLSSKYLTDKTYRTQINCEAKLRTIQFIYYVQTELGQSNWAVANDEGYNTPYNREDNSCDIIPSSLKAIERNLPVMPYVRESNRGIGAMTLTGPDIKRIGTPPKGAKSFPTSIAVGDYPNDLHGCNAMENLETNMENTTDTTGSGPFQIPIETLISKDVAGLIFAEKNISVSRLVNGATRLQPVTMVTGQAAGALAALAAKQGKPPSASHVSEVQARLVAAKASVVPFTDVPSTDPAFKEIQQAAATGIMVGGGNLTFSPNNPLSRGQAAAVITKAFGIPHTSPQQATFTDVPTTHTFYGPIEALSASGITSGCNAAPKQFCPETPVTNAQFATLILRAAQRKDETFQPITPTTSTYSDVPTNHFAYTHIEGMAKKGLTFFCTTGTKQFCPDTQILRKEAATMIIRTRQLLDTSVTSTTTPSPTSAPTYSEADMNTDGKITIVDYTLFMNYWFAKDIARSDLNKDGKISAIDYTIFMNAWNETR